MQLTSEQVVESIRDVRPGQIRKHVVEINGVDYPVNQVFARATGLDPIKVNTAVAVNKLEKLGFTCKRVGPL